MHSNLLGGQKKDKGLYPVVQQTNFFYLFFFLIHVWLCYKLSEFCLNTNVHVHRIAYLNMPPMYMYMHAGT